MNPTTDAERSQAWVESGRWNGPGDYFTTHWLVMTKDGPLLNDRKRLKKFRVKERAEAAAMSLNQEPRT